MTRLRADGSHPRAQRLLAAMQGGPCTLRGLIRKTGIPSGTAVHHVNVLLRNDLAWTFRTRHALWHLAGPRPDEVQVRHVLATLTENAKHAYDAACMLEAPVKQMDIIAALEPRGLVRSTAQHAIKQAEKAGVMNARRSGRFLTYFAQDRTVLVDELARAERFS